MRREEIGDREKCMKEREIERENGKEKDRC